MVTPAEIAAMRRALELARMPDAPLGPNPRVGCVLLDPGGAEIAEGYGRGAGSRHAEIDALQAAGDRAVGATAVVTLEPCNHTGRTGPCAEALRAAGIARLVFGQADANPVARGGAETLRAAGIEVEGGVLADEARAVNPIWTFAVEMARPFVTWKLAATLDGRSAAADGTSRWITSPQARVDVHRLRAECDVIVVGIGTVLADDPALTVRDPDGRPLEPRFQPLRAVMGRREIPPHAAIRDGAADTVHLATRDPHEALATLFARDRQHVWLEGGPTVAAAFVRAGLVDRVVAYVAPALLGSGVAALGDAGLATVDDAIRLEFTDMTQIGPDIRLIARPEKG
jgi:diaminohydroxyphosphoribosylaminopyrimidine deaminase / 5-amino-6-(5-phosphoribosylamino)uracil reductase